MGTLATIPGAGLATLATDINEQHERAVMYVGQSFDAAVRAGLLLIDAKEQVPHGQWLKWLKANVKVGARQAANYMRVATCPDDNPSEVAVDHPTLPSDDLGDIPPELDRRRKHG